MESNKYWKKSCVIRIIDKRFPWTVHIYVLKNGQTKKKVVNNQ